MTEWSESGTDRRGGSPNTRSTPEMSLLKRPAIEKGCPDARDAKFTDWERVREFGLEFLRSVQPHALDATVGTA